MTHVELLEDTVKYYSEDTNRRASNENGCSYRMNKDDGTIAKCALGRLIPDNEYKVDLESKPLIEVIKGCSSLRCYDQEFLIKLQSFHDDDDCWIENGLSLRGIMRRDDLLELAKKLDDEED